MISKKDLPGRGMWCEQGLQDMQVYQQTCGWRAEAAAGEEEELGSER